MGFYPPLSLRVLSLSSTEMLLLDKPSLYLCCLFIIYFCDLLSCIGVACMSMDEGYFTEARATPPKVLTPLSSNHNCPESLREGDALCVPCCAPWSFHGPILARSPQPQSVLD